MFVKNFSIILARALNIHIINEDNYIKKVSCNIQIPQFNNDINNSKKKKNEKLMIF